MHSGEAPLIWVCALSHEVSQLQGLTFGSKIHEMLTYIFLLGKNLHKCVLVI